MELEIYRGYQDENQTSGLLTIKNEEGFVVFSAVSLERGWNDNKSNTSCVPCGVYDLVLEYSPRFKRDLWELKGVRGRSECKFHSANFWNQLNGCISLGQYYTEINGDGYLDLKNSVNTMNAFHRVLSGLEKVKLTIY